MGSNPWTGRYIVDQMTSINGSALSLDPIPSGRLKNLKDVDKWSSFSNIIHTGKGLCFSEAAGLRFYYISHFHDHFRYS